MTAPHKPSCVQVTNMTMVEPFQVCFGGVVYAAGETVTDVPAAEADRWIENGWAAQATRASEGAKTAPPSPSRRK
jgi:hypothetical protein